jgi:hypothetical protein
MNILPDNQPTLIRPIINLINWLTKKLKDLFSLEEVEVTFNKEGYTYTKVSHN